MNVENDSFVMSTLVPNITRVFEGQYSLKPALKYLNKIEKSIDSVLNVHFFFNLCDLSWIYFHIRGQMFLILGEEKAIPLKDPVLLILYLLSVESGCPCPEKINHFILMLCSHYINMRLYCWSVRTSVTESSGR